MGGIFGAGGAGGLALIEHQDVAAAVAAVDFVGIDDTYRALLLAWGGFGTTVANAELRLRVQSGGTWQASSYQGEHEQFGALAAGPASFSSEIVVGHRGADAAPTDETVAGYAWVFHPAGVGTYAFIEGHSVEHQGSGPEHATRFWGYWNGGLGAITGLRLLRASGDIDPGADGGWAALYGLKR